ncbi:MAG: oligoendopeptidase F, partial [Clostridia bacterium]|nr:oligoendopeptidase F [Clostridia bacterium]
MAIKERDQIDNNYKWKLEDIFSSDDEWEECYFSTSERMCKISSFNGKLNDDDTLFDCLTFNSGIKHDLSRLYQYAHMRRDEDTRKTIYQGMDDRAMTLYVQYGSMVSFLTPELTSFDDKKLDALISSKRFSDYSVLFEEIKR